MTEQEKAAIIKRAEAEGEDINEVDIYIQSLQQKRQQEFNEKAQQAATEEIVAQKKAREARDAAAAEEDKERAKLLRKCPACGTPIPATTNVCPNCGHIVESSDITNEISEIIKLIRRCAPYDAYIDGSLEFHNSRGKNVCDKDPELNKTYDIIGEFKLGGIEYYKIKSKYNELLSELRLKYGASPLVQSFLREEKKRNFELIKSKLDFDLRDPKLLLIHAKKCFEVIKAQYAELIDESFINTYDKKIQEAEKEAAEIAAKEAAEIAAKEAAERAAKEAAEKTIIGKLKKFFGKG